jgi:hypothetical protein
MYRNFYNLLESRCFLRPFSWLAVWNDGIVECWKTGYEKRKKVYSKKMLYLHFMMMTDRPPFSAFAPETTPLLRENQYNYIRFDSLNPPFHYPRTRYFMIPIFHNSNIPIGAKPLTCVFRYKWVFRFSHSRANARSKLRVNHLGAGPEFHPLPGYGTAGGA